MGLFGGGGGGGFVPSVPGVPKVALPTAKDIYGRIKNPYGSGTSVPGLPGKSPLDNTPLDAGSYTSTLKDMLQGLGVGGPPKAKATYGSQIATPDLPDYTGIGTLGDKGVLQASSVTGADISKQMEESPWYKMALQKQAAEQGLQMNQAGQQNASGAAQAMSNLAMRGGLRSGASERLAGQSGENTALMRQNILGQGAVERGNLGMQGANLSSNIAQYNAGNQQQAQFGNVQNQIANLGNVNDQNRFRYGEQMKLKGAGMSAQAMENAGKK